MHLKLTDEQARLIDSALSILVETGGGPEDFEDFELCDVRNYIRKERLRARAHDTEPHPDVTPRRFR